MATYNGEKYVAEQLESLYRQTMNDFVIYIHDDCSTDNTWEIVHLHETRYPGKIKAERNKYNSGGAKYNFINMMIGIKDDYIMLCDQDDVWLPDKVEKTITKLKIMESECGKTTPLLVHTDLKVVDADLNIIFPSFRIAMNVGYARTELRHLVIQNIITGCSAAYNRALAELITVEPAYMVMHDWWIGLIASAFGKIKYLDEQTALYRQHGKNGIGARDVRAISYKFHTLTHGKNVHKALNQTYGQARSFLQLYGSLLNKNQTVFLSDYIQIPRHNKLIRLIMVSRLRVFKHGIARKIANLLFI
jgi:glycosyltransferase involved in cell wall biosynthesis